MGGVGETRRVASSGYTGEVALLVEICCVQVARSENHTEISSKLTRYSGEIPLRTKGTAVKHGEGWTQKTLRMIQFWMIRSLSTPQLGSAWSRNANRNSPVSGAVEALSCPVKKKHHKNQTRNTLHQAAAPDTANAQHWADLL